MLKGRIFNYFNLGYVYAKCFENVIYRTLFFSAKTGEVFDNGKHYPILQYSK